MKRPPKAASAPARPQPPLPFMDRSKYVFGPTEVRDFILHRLEQGPTTLRTLITIGLPHQYTADVTLAAFLLLRKSGHVKSSKVDNQVVVTLARKRGDA